MSGRWESQEGSVDLVKYNLSLLKEPERTNLRHKVTSENLRKRVVEELYKAAVEEAKLDTADARWDGQKR
jgi:hypothetical protein